MISQDYLYTLQHEHRKHPWGYWGYELAPEVRAFCDLQAVKSVLDYGCGSNHGLRAWATKNLWAIDLREYDIAIPGYDSEPEPAELVMCIDVLEHVEEQYVDDVLDHIHSRCSQWAWFTISLKPAQRTLQRTGQNAHITLKERGWWLPKLEDRWQMEMLDYNADWLKFRGRRQETAQSLRLKRLDRFLKRVSK